MKDIITHNNYIDYKKKDNNYQSKLKKNCNSSVKLNNKDERALDSYFRKALDLERITDKGDRIDHTVAANELIRAAKVNAFIGCEEQIKFANCDAKNIVAMDDINYLLQQSPGKINMILSQMITLMNDTDNKVARIECQNWFQRMIKTVLGQNKATLNEIKENHDKLNMYMAEAITHLYNKNCIGEEIMISLSTKLNELYTNNIQVKQMLGDFVHKLNEKIESVDNFHILETEIEQDVYSEFTPICAICKILSQIDKRTLEDSRKMDILKRSLKLKNIITNDEILLIDYLNNILEISVNDIGSVYLGLEVFSENYLANIFLKMIEKYHFLPDMERKLKNKQSLIDDLIKEEKLDDAIKLSISSIYDDFIQTKIEMNTQESQLAVDENQIEIKDNLKDNDIYRYDNGEMYEGQLVNGKREGKGTLYRIDGSKIYEGQWRNDKKEGKGILYDTNGSKGYEGQWVNDKIEGDGILYKKDGITICYKGEWINNTPKDLLFKNVTVSIFCFPYSLKESYCFKRLRELLGK